MENSYKSSLKPQEINILLKDFGLKEKTKNCFVIAEKENVLYICGYFYGFRNCYVSFVFILNGEKSIRGTKGGKYSGEKFHLSLENEVIKKI